MVVTFSLPHVIPELWVTATIVALALGLLHLLFLPGFILKVELPRSVSYIIGMGVVLGCFTVLYVTVWHDLQPVLDIWFLAVAGAIPTIGFRLLRDYAHKSDKE